MLLVPTKDPLPRKPDLDSLIQQALAEDNTAVVNALADLATKDDEVLSQKAAAQMKDVMEVAAALSHSEETRSEVAAIFQSTQLTWKQLRTEFFTSKGVTFMQLQQLTQIQAWDRFSCVQSQLLGLS